ncbi:hypothetical protein, partial [Desulfosarcina sp.]|uniref:hypothetical protein n=1 Tax=Desulfosarcina sp. TaxID=2027861 RepID=UPI003970EB65
EVTDTMAEQLLSELTPKLSQIMEKHESEIAQFEPQQRAHSPSLAAGLASESKIDRILTVEDSSPLAARFFNSS